MRWAKKRWARIVTKFTDDVDFFVDSISVPSWVFEGYSDFWRVNKSIIEAHELANVLRALRKVAGYIGGNVGSVEWASEEKQSTGVIKVNPSFLLHDYPVKPGKMDLLVGKVAHEALHQKEWSDWTWSLIEQKIKEMPFREKDIFWKMVTAGEDIYVDKLAAKSNFGLYTQKYRKFMATREKIELAHIPKASVLYTLWKYRVLDNEIWEQINLSYLKPLEILMMQTDRLVKIGDEKLTVTKKCELRSEFYLELWFLIREIVIPWKMDKITYFALEPSGQKQEIKGKKTKKAGTPTQKDVLSLQLEEDIEQSLAVGSTDLTPLVKAVCSEEGKKEVIPTSIWEFNILAHPNIDPYLVGRLKGIFQTYADRVKVINRGLKSGSLDKRRLYRAPITGNCFLFKQYISEMSWNITLVIDASRSMEGSKWMLTENIVASLHKALEGYENKLQIVGYFEHDGICIISPLLRKKKLYALYPNGRTPSGQAIIAAALLMPKEKKRRFIIHITDGESNCGCKVEHALKYCQKEKIDVVTLGCNYKKRDILVEQYGSSVQFIDYFEQLPKVLESLLRRKLLAS